MVFMKTRIKILVFVVATALAGFAMWRYYRGWAEYWVRFYITGAVYEIFWSLAFFFFWPRRACILRIPIIVFAATCALEFLQLWKPQPLQQFRATLVGQALIGTDFVWLQIPFYVAGTLISVLLLKMLAGREPPD